MKVTVKALSCVLLAFTAVLCGCGFTGYPITQTPILVEPASTLGGNWLIYGTPPKLTFNSTTIQPGLTMSFNIHDGKIDASAFLQDRCPNGDGFADIFVNGISSIPTADGKFATTQTVFAGVTFTITGTAPNTSGTPWAGTYKLANDASFIRDCAWNLSGSFTATPIADLTGTFAGSSPVAIFRPHGMYTLPANTVVGVQANLKQRVNSPGSSGPVGYSDQFVDGTVAVTGIPCFSKGQASTQQASVVLGNDYRLRMTMDDGSEAYLEGTIVNTATTQLYLDDLDVLGGNCSGLYQFYGPPMILRR